MAVTSPAAPAATSAPAKLGWRQYSGYATGDAANNLAFAMASSFLLLYYTNVVGLGGAAIGTMFLLIRFWDAFADLFAGRMVDGKKPGRFGKFRPFIMWFSLPLLLSSMAIFSAKTFFPNISESQALIYAYVSYAVMGTLYSMVNIPYGSIAPAMTQVPTERAKLASWRVWGSNLTILMLSFIVAPQIKKYAGDAAGLQRSLFITTAIFVVLGMALYLWTVMNVKEQVQRDVAAPSIRESFGTLTHNKPLLWLCLGSLSFLTGMTAIGAPRRLLRPLRPQRRDLHRVELGGAGRRHVPGRGVHPEDRADDRQAQRLHRPGIRGCPGRSASWPSSHRASRCLSLIGFFLLGIGMGGVNTLMWALEADTVEYGEWKTGIRTEGTTYAMFSFTRKMGQAIGGAAGAFALGFVGFNSAAAKAGETQSADAIHGVQLATGLLTAGFILVSLLVMWFYPLTDKVYREIVSEIAARRATREATDASAATA